jgi:hypothetical protein
VLEFSDVAVAHAIQLAVAPVFLLSGIAAILAVMTSRLGRIIDRARVLEDRLDNASAELHPALRTDLATLSRRAKLISCAITLCTATALLVCTVIAVLFLSAFFALRRVDSRSSPVYRRNVGFFSRAIVVSAGDLCGHGEPSYRTTLSHSHFQAPPVEGFSFSSCMPNY